MSVELILDDLETKRREVLNLLLEITKGGRPEDSLAAACFAVALENNPIEAAGLANIALERFDLDVLELWFPQYKPAPPHARENQEYRAPEARRFGCSEHAQRYVGILKP